MAETPHELEAVEVSAERERSAEVVWSNGQYELVVRDQQALPFEEGTHIQLRPVEQGDQDWRVASTKSILQESALSIWPARVVAEFGHTEDGWSNQHFDPKFPEGINVYGRKPLNERAWGQRGAQPVIKTGSGFEVPENAAVRENMATFMERTMPAWERALKKVELFSGDSGGLDPEGEAFKRRAAGYREKLFPFEESLLWANEKFDVVMIDRPHLNGTHIVVHPSPEYWDARGGFKKPWQLEKVSKGKQPSMEHQVAFLESVAIAREVEQLYKVTMDQPDANSELHSSANWSGDLRWKSRGGRFDEEAYQEANSTGKLTKMLHDTEPGTAYHMHIYIPEVGYVSLPSRKLDEASDEWAHVRSNFVPVEGKPPEEWTELREEYVQRCDAFKEVLYTNVDGQDYLSSRLKRDVGGKLFN